MQIFEDYRALHRIPELDDQLPKTVGYVKSRLSSLGCRVFSPIKGSVCAFFYFGQRKTLAFRADMDALPIQEQTTLGCHSVHPGIMHACGHDGHTAILLETARRIRPCQYNILLIFQPAEETSGGAQDLCETGLLEQFRVCAIFALHLWPGLEKGKLFSRPGVLMSSASGVRAEFQGKAVHVAGSEQGADALAACCRFYCRACKLPCFLKFGKLTGGSAGNVVCDRAVLEGTLRTEQKPQQRIYQRTLENLCRQACRETGCQGTVAFSGGYPAVYNDPALYRRIEALWPLHKLPDFLWTAEDFSCYQQRVPGVYFLLGAGNIPSLHSPTFCFEESILLQGAELFQRIVTASDI